MLSSLAPIPTSADEAALSIDILCCYSLKARDVIEVPIQLPKGTCVLQAVELIQHRLALPATAVQSVGVWGSLVDGAYELQPGDRLEFYRALTVDPKVARRQRFKKQGAKRSGLFAKRRPGAVAGY